VADEAECLAVFRRLRDKRRDLMGAFVADH